MAQCQLSSSLITAPHCQITQSLRHLYLFVCGARFKIVLQKFSYPRAWREQINFNQICTPQVMPLSTARGFPGCIMERDAILRHNTFQLRTQKYLSPPNSLLVFAPKRLPPGWTRCLGSKCRIIDKKAEEMGELTAC